MSDDPWQVSEEVAHARDRGGPVVVLESTIITHGLPRPLNLDVARRIEATVREAGAVPATIAIRSGRVVIGLSESELTELALGDSAVKASVRDIGPLLIEGATGSTTVAATAHLAARQGLRVFATGGIGGVHRGAVDTWDESADLTTLSRCPITVVSAGIKSILDIAATLERLETLGVGVVTYRSSQVPGFYLSDSGHAASSRVDTPDQVAQLMAVRDQVGDPAALLVFQGLPEDRQMDPAFHDDLLRNGLAAADARGVRGKDVTPFLLQYFHERSEGASLEANIEIILNNAHLAAQIAVARAQA